MRHAPILKIEPYRDTMGPLASTAADGNNGRFFIPHHGALFCVIASDGGGWDHVSVSLPYRCPYWAEMAAIKDLFFHEAEAVFQYHPPRAVYVNYHPYCLHLWRPQTAEIILPPTELVGPMD